MSLFIGIDSGTQSVKAVVLDLETRQVVAEARAPHKLIESLPVGHMEQHPAEWATACMNWDTGRRRVCGFPLAELPRRPASAEMLEVQDLYLRAAGGQSLRLAGKEVTPAAWFAEMSQLVGLARLAGPRGFPGLDALSGASVDVWREDHVAGDGRRSWAWRSCPPSPELAAALLHEPPGGPALPRAGC